MAKGGWDVGTWNDAEWSSLPLTGVAATSAVGSVGVTRTDTLDGAAATGETGTAAGQTTVSSAGVSATGEVGSVGVSPSAALAGVEATGATGTVTASAETGLTGVSATGLVGDEEDSVTVALAGVGANGALGDLERSASLGITGVAAATALGDVTASIQPVIIVGLDSHEGDKKRHKKWKDDAEAQERRKRELIDVYEQLVEGRPAVAQAIVKPYVKAPTRRIAQPTIDWNRLVADLDRVEAIYREHREMDDEDILLLL